MKEKRLRRKGEGPHIVPAALPTLITVCPKCGGEIELWSETLETNCVFCNYKVFDREGTIH